MSGKACRKRFLHVGTAALSAVLILASAGCFGSRRADIPPSEPAGTESPDNAAAVKEIPPAIPIVEEPAPAAKAGAPVEEAAGTPVPGREEPKTTEASPAPPGKPHMEAPPPRKPRVASPQETPAPPAPAAPVPAAPTPAVAAPVPAPPPPPAWARQNESLAFRVDFLGITMGYARFHYRGKASIAGKTAYHVNVRAWTSGILSYIYPINETIDYYLDNGTMLPIRIEYTGRKNKRDDVAIYDQENGRIVYRYRDTGELRRKVDVVPSIHDPVSATYYFRWRDMGREDRPKNVYGGRKVYQISTVSAGSERLKTGSGEIDTLVFKPVIRLGGKVEDKGDLRIWVTNDERRVPVRIYGKFRKIREWTLVGELMPERTGG